MNVNKLRDSYFVLYESLKKKMISRYNIKLINSHLSGKNLLTKEEMRELSEFWAPYTKVDSIFHRFYKEKTGTFYANYLPTDVYINCIDEHFNDRNASHVLDNKCLYSRLFAGVAQPEAIASRMGGFWYDSNQQPISLAAVKRIMSKESSFFMKVAARSYGGKGVQYIDSRDGSVVDQFEQALKSMPSDIVVQRPLRQHAALCTINESSVNTIRILSLLTEDGVVIYSSILRMGVAGAKVDNASSGGITCGIAEDGKLKKYAYKPSGERFTVHPTSGVVFEGYTIPNFEDAKELVKKAHHMVPHFRMVSWDVAIDENGDAVMIEANFAKGELDFHQLNNGPLFGEDTKKILDEVFGK